MHYQVTEDEKRRAKTPHHIFNINIIITHLFISMIVLEIGDTIALLLVPFISTLVIAWLYSKTKKVIANDTWFVASHWFMAWRRGRILLISYGIAIAMVAIYTLIDMIFPGGFSMNDFSTEGGQTNLGEIITIRFAAVVIFVAVLITFMQTGISVYDAGNGISNPSLEKFLPRTADSNAELGEGKDEVSHTQTKQMESSDK
ncbi:hypothetical protein QCB45_09240 [Thiomicrorhabdus sp. ZW0627]|uniref:hypothetical protein n=1 Tax=Thiomicrorhabdus sp. ZW0627 TaxID=3039774 RepID=UPI002436CA67|nr:hypothetical protein [Thiomicrorhabdus sp. ZW0627]MDG6774515.1 hypothetical protein [Thiomicrorhabdus sp. ZW0627]